MLLGRRELLNGAFGAWGMISYPRLFGAPRLGNDNQGGEHFFLMITFPGGLDQSYFLDARPLAMTAASLQQNYSQQEPTIHTGANGQSCLVGSSASGILPWLSEMAVVNGVVMAHDNAGHDENITYLMTGGTRPAQPFLNFFSHAFPLDYFSFEQHDHLMQFSNSGLRLSSLAGVARLSGRLQPAKRVFQNPELAGSTNALIQTAVATGGGLFSRGAARHSDAFLKSSRVTHFLDQYVIAEPIIPLQSQLDFSIQAFKAGLVKASLIRGGTGNEFFDADAHAPAQSAQYPAVAARFVDRISKCLATLKRTQFDESRTMLDVTTVMITSEFGRTMRQREVAIGSSGTDHNMLNNTFLLAGKGIQRGVVVGASDFQNPKEILSKAHLSLDPYQLSVCGRPFDFAAGIPNNVLPDTFRLTDYLTASSVANTIMDLFGVPSSNWHYIPGTRSLAPLIGGIRA